MLYWILVAVIIILLSVLVFFIRKSVKADSSTDISATMITSGIALIASAFPGIKEMLVSIIASCFGKQIEVGSDYVAVVCGFALILIGILYGRTIKDRIFVLNMLGMFSQIEISDLKNIKQLKLADYKVKETLIDFVDVFNNGSMSYEKNSIITKKIKKQCESFKSKSSDFKACFTGMAPIPYTILAGYYLSGGSIQRFFEYKGADNKYIELKKRTRKSLFPKLSVHYPDTIRENSSDLTLAISITMRIREADIAQFNYDVIDIGLDQPKNNVIESVEQLADYCDMIITEIENTKKKYPNLKKIHLVAAIPSCISEKIGEQLSLRSNRLPQVIAYHYRKNSIPQYQFGIVVSDDAPSQIGQLVLPEERCS